MKLYSGRIPVIAEEMTRELIKAEAIEVEPGKAIEVRLDIESVLKEYLRTDRRISDEARDLVEKRGLDFSAFGKIKREVAKRQDFALGDLALGWIVEQLLQLFMHTAHIEEVWAEDHDLRRLMKPILNRHMNMDEDLDGEVRKRIKNLKEGTTSWDIKYQQVKEDLKRRRGLE